MGMYREQVCFLCPYTQSEFRSKSFAAFKQANGINYAQFLGLPKLVPSQKATAIKADFKEKLAIVLPTENWFTECTATSTGEAKSTFKSGSEEAYKTNTIVEVRVAGGMANQPPIIKVLDQKVNNRGSNDAKCTVHNYFVRYRTVHTYRTYRTVLGFLSWRS